MSGECYGCGHHIMDCICEYAGLGDDAPSAGVMEVNSYLDGLSKALTNLRAERDAYRATLMDIAAVKHPDQQRTPHQEMARECVRKWEAGK